MKKKKNLTDTELADSVRDAIGAELMGKLAAQPTGIANGGAETILQRACTEAAGFPDPVATAVAKFRVLCGSKAVQPKTPATEL